MWAEPVRDEGAARLCWCSGVLPEKSGPLHEDESGHFIALSFEWIGPRLQLVSLAQRGALAAALRRCLF